MNEEPKVLIVEDDPTVVRYYDRAFERAGYRHTIVDSRDAALNLLHRSSFACAVVDLQLRNDISHKGGIDVLEYIERCNEGTVKLAVSASQDLKDAVQSYRLGVVEFVMKGELKKYDDVVPIVAAALTRHRPAYYGRSYDSINAYVSAPEGVVFWEGSAQNTLRASVQNKLQHALDSTFSKLLPVLRRRDGSVPFHFHADKMAMTARLWSKGDGSEIFVCLYGSGGHSVPPALGTAELILEKTFAGINSKVWRLPDGSRGEYVDFIDDTPWVKPREEGRKRAPGGAPEAQI